MDDQDVVNLSMSLIQGVLVSTIFMMYSVPAAWSPSKQFWEATSPLSRKTDQLCLLKALCMSSLSRQSRTNTMIATGSRSE